MKRLALVLAIAFVPGAIPVAVAVASYRWLRMRRNRAEIVTVLRRESARDWRIIVGRS